MPIVELIPETEPLCQGDILKGISLFATGAGLADAKKCKLGHCLVLSRPCAALHQPKIVVAAVNSFDMELSKDSIANPTVESVTTVLRDIRDGWGRPDSFYLGTFPGDPRTRYGALFNSLHTIEVPEDREKFVREHRLCRLSKEFLRDLQIRLFRAFTSSGFDDYQWFADEDLDTVILAGQAELAAATAVLQQGNATDAMKDMAGKMTSTKETDAKNERIKAVQTKLAPYQKEQDRRKALLAQSTDTASTSGSNQSTTAEACPQSRVPS